MVSDKTTAMTAIPPAQDNIRLLAATHSAHQRAAAAEEAARHAKAGKEAAIAEGEAARADATAAKVERL